MVEENEISKVILDAAISVHKELGGPGLLESYYEFALMAELQSRGLVINFGQKTIKEGWQRVANNL